MHGIACPNCASALNRNAHGRWACGSCQIDFPQLGDVPFLWPAPGAALKDWRNRFNHTLAELDTRREAYDQARSDLAATAARLDRMRDGLTTYDAALRSLLAPLGVGEGAGRETYLALRSRLPDHHAVDSYVNLMARDWVWGAAETDAAAGLLDRAVQTAAATPRHVLVLGAGAGRLAYDLQQRWSCESTVALDSNPLLCLTGAAMARGESAPFVEFPTAPIKPEDAAVSCTLAAPAAESRLTFVCADALNAPILPGAFDLIATPWLLDVIDSDTPSLLQRIAALLAPGGLWLTHGSVAFERSAPAERLTAEELKELTAQHGFEVLTAEDAAIAYLHSPHSRHHRTETVFTQLSRRTEAAVTVPVAHAHVPDWLADTSRPVPLSPEFRTQLTTTRINGFIMSLIDGKRSINDMARVLEKQRLMPARDATEAIRQFMKTMHGESEAQKRSTRL